MNKGNTLRNSRFFMNTEGATPASDAHDQKKVRSWGKGVIV